MMMMMMLQGSRVHTNKIEGLMTKFVMSSKMAKLECENHMEGIIREFGSYHHSMPLAMFPFRNLVQKILPFGPCLFAVSVATFRKLRGSPI
jgi:hypothetical protein